MTRSSPGRARIAPAPEPLDPGTQAAIDRVMRGNPPLLLFTTLARDRRLFAKFFGSGLLDRGHLTLRQREIVIDRTTALCGAEYEWGVHITLFAHAAELPADQITSLLDGDSGDECWNDDDRVLIDLCDALHAAATVDDSLWARLTSRFTEEAILELLMLAGFYHTTSYLVNALALPPEHGMARFADYADPASTSGREH
ncbi:carboxymuconolactone decarboxylase family protein [Nocardia asteroides]|uniref:carboxymuconolactone decarboxylase family protein n=1 Tax=Nocardia asteroides TaxID=1824 RepID=UPI001E33C1CD|nr:carboxymuconolactone decarboxylase family protein [Nocardia asteroides]UGT62195.1 carboxymuconolactone decarboxylase family protein [Nocardia asteroides]